MYIIHRCSLWRPLAIHWLALWLLDSTGTALHVTQRTLVMGVLMAIQSRFFMTSQSRPWTMPESRPWTMPVSHPWTMPEFHPWTMPEARLAHAGHVEGALLERQAGRAAAAVQGMPRHVLRHAERGPGPVQRVDPRYAPARRLRMEVAPPPLPLVPHTHAHKSDVQELFPLRCAFPSIVSKHLPLGVGMADCHSHSSCSGKGKVTCQSAEPYLCTRD